MKIKDDVSQLFQDAYPCAPRVNRCDKNARTPAHNIHIHSLFSVSSSVLPPLFSLSLSRTFCHFANERRFGTHTAR